MVGGTSIAALDAPGVLHVPVPGGRIAVAERGSGVPVLFLHGGTGTGELDWGAVAERLSARYRTLVVDLRGHGSSVNDGTPLGVVRFGLDVLHVLRAVGAPRAVLVGFSAGGNTLLELLARDPRPALALVTVGAAARGDVSRVERIMTGPWPQRLVALEHAVGHGPGYWQDLRAQLARDWAAHVDLDRRDLERITCPALVCHGTGDHVQRVDDARHLAALLPEGELWLVEGAGHAVQLDQPELFAARVQEFLGRVLRGRRHEQGAPDPPAWPASVRYGRADLRLRGRAGVGHGSAASETGRDEK